MRALTPEVSAVLREFEWTHEITATPGGAWWRLARLPRAGAVGDQDARLMAALDYVRELENELLAQELKRRRRDPDEELEELRTH